MPTDRKPSDNEDEYFARQDAELLRARRAKLDADRQNAERKAHWMKCPNCGADMKERVFHHIKIDVCPDCGGTFLHKGELEILTHVERNSLSRFLGIVLGLGDK